MKIISLITMCLVFTASFAQEPYDSLWKEVEKLEKEGLTQSALKKVQSIASRAEKENNTIQHIKTLLYESKYALVLEEDAQLSIINNFKKRIEKSTSPEKNMLQNLLANLYWQYFQENRYRFYDRTHTAEKIDDSDFRTWDLGTLFHEIDMLFRTSLEDVKKLQTVDLSTLKELLIIKEDSKEFHPTLYDFLSHNALNFYQTDENSITQPAYKFEIDNPDYLCQAELFSEMELTSEDSTSLQLQALKIYQNLTKFHLYDKSPEALTQVNIKRLRFVKQNARFDNVNDLFLVTLQNEKNKFNDPKNTAPYDFEIAYLYFQQGQEYSTDHPENRWKLKEATEICNQVTKQAPDTTSAENCQALKSQIEQASLQIQAENFIPVQQHSRVLVTYKNIDSLDFTLYEFSKSKEEKLNKQYQQKDKLKYIQSLKAHQQWTTTLLNENDYQQHTTEVVIPQLPQGMYLMVAKQSNEIFAYKTLQVTVISMTKTDTQNEVIYQFLDRNSGVALSGVKATVTFQENYSDKPKSQSFTSDSNGNVFFRKNSRYYYDVEVEAHYQKETAYFSDGYIYGRSEREKETTKYKGFLFTDRSIYRPGQTVYFKGITLKTENKKSEILPNEPLYVLLYNVNSEEIKRLELVTNEYGSVSGEFILPNDGLTGQFRIRLLGKKHTLDNSESRFSVEEYKRPKFETSFNPVTETFKINDSITVKGLAQAYAGSNITDAKVVYRVHRQVEYPRWYYWYRPSFYSEAQEITHGETQTNDQGEFEITFKAIPDLSAKAENLPIFHYEITADVTDINGETRSATTIVNVGYHAMTANVVSGSSLDKSSKDNKLTIVTQNLNGQDVNATGTVYIYKLQAPQNVLRPRPWQAPDYQTLSKDEFKALFPHDAYKDENNPNTWEKGKQVFKESFDTGKSKELDLGNMKKWQPGLYKIELVSQDKFGQKVKDQLLVTVFDSKNKTVLDNNLFAASLDKKEYLIGNTVELSLASAAENLTVYVEIEKNKAIVNSQKVQLNNEVKTIKIPVDETDLGGFVIHVHYAMYNHFGYQELNVLIPYPKTDLEIETLTFRDKLQPGQDETWSFKIKGPKGEQVSAELLASMYDASLDQFQPHAWSFNPIYQPTYYSVISKNNGNSFGIGNFRVHIPRESWFNYPQLVTENWNWYGLSFGGWNYLARGYVAGISVEEDAIAFANKSELGEVIVVGYGSTTKEAYTEIVGNISRTDTLDIGYEDFKTKSERAETSNKKEGETVLIRKNLQETAFFFPQLQTDDKGHVTFSFTSPEALTKWKLQLLAYTKDLNSSVKTLEAVTQKELMVIPNAPRFLREGDNIVVSAKIANLSNKALSGQAELHLFDAVTGKEITNLLVVERSRNNKDTSTTLSVHNFQVDSKNNTQVSWTLTIPNNVQAVQYKVIAKAGDFSDGEQNALPVLSNRMLVTETLPMWIRSNETRTFVLDKLKTNTSTTLSQHKLTLEMTSNPAWYAVQALPYLMEYPYECNEQTFSRYYANALASHIANSNPRLQEVFNQWKNSDALLSNLEKNQELKSLLIQETPWLRDAQSETEQKKRIGLLFDLNKMNSELNTNIGKLKRNQLYNGAWPWFNGGRPNRFITQHIITGFGHLKQLNVASTTLSAQQDMIQKAINYLDTEFVEEHKNLKKYDQEVDLTKDHLSYTQLHYLYMRSFFPEIKRSKEVQEITNYYLGQIKSYWLSRTLYAKGMMALVTHRANDTATSEKIIRSLKETSIANEELGMYWKENTASWYWYQAPIETQALLIETFSEIGYDSHKVDIDNMKIWLLKNKQTNKWETTKATTEAIYALLLQGSDWLSVTDAVEVLVGNQKIEPSKLENVSVEAGTGYYKTSWNGNEITPEKATVTLTKKGDGIAWGSLYWQYFEDLDKITSAETSLKLKKKLFLKTNTDKGEQLSEITESTTLKVGDLVRVRIELRSDRDMEFVHMKDLRAAGLEPINVLSQYKWQDGLGYYESTKDAATNFFFDYLPKGVYVFEYDLRVNNAGNMSNGITTIQCMYAPEFTSHSEGVRIKVE